MLLTWHRRVRGGASANTPPPVDGGEPIDPSFPLVAARHSDALVDVLGANSHVTYGPATTYIYRQGGPYPTPVAALRAAISYVGVRHIRETLGIGSQMRNVLTELDDLVDFTFAGTYINATNRPSAQQVANEVLTHYADSCEAVSGFNEPDLKRNTIADWVAQTVDFQQDLWAALGPTPIKVLTPPMAGRTYTYLGNLAPYCDVNDLHIYPGGNKPSTDIAFHVNASQSAAPGKPVWVTECGYENALNYRGGNPPVPEDVAGIYAPRLLLEHFIRGTQRAFFYELGDSRRNDALDNREDHFGLFAYGPQAVPTWRPKPAATGLRGVTQLAADPGVPYTPSPLPLRVTSSVTVQQSLVGKRDGSHLLFLARDVSIWTPSTTTAGARVSVATQPVTVEFGRAYQVRRHTWNPNGTVTVSDLGLTRSASVSLGAALVALEIELPTA